MRSPSTTSTPSNPASRPSTPATTTSARRYASSCRCCGTRGTSPPSGGGVVGVRAPDRGPAFSGHERRAAEHRRSASNLFPRDIEPDHGARSHEGEGRAGQDRLLEFREFTPIPAPTVGGADRSKLLVGLEIGRQVKLADRVVVFSLGNNKLARDIELEHLAPAPVVTTILEEEHVRHSLRGEPRGLALRIEGEKRGDPVGEQRTLPA